jgi:glucose/arabinose dehydrogenase
MSLQPIVRHTASASTSVFAAAFAGAAVVLAALTGSAHAQTPAQTQPLRPVTVAEGLENPWSVAFFPDFETSGKMLVTEKRGRLRIVTRDGKLGEPIGGVPKVDARGQGGLLDVVLDPGFTDNGLVYLSFSEPAPDGRANSTAVVRGKLEGDRLTGVKVIFSQRPKVDSGAHFGSRLVFAPDGKLFITMGDRFSRRDDAQKLENLHGKIVRINPDGSIPPDNPFVKTPGAAPEIWTYGHRNVQGAAWNAATAELWTQEHGPQGGDEVNVEQAGHNYGWPVITYGAEYVTGAKIGEGTAKEGMEQPITYWVPSIAPSGMAFLTSDRYPGWKGNLFVGALKAQLLVRLQLDGHKVVREERLLESLHERIRDVRQAPDGWLYVLTDSSSGRLIRLER